MHLVMVCLSQQELLRHTEQKYWSGDYLEEVPGFSVSFEVCKWKGWRDFPAGASNCDEVARQRSIPPLPPPCCLFFPVSHLSDSILCFCSTCSLLDFPAVRVWHVFNKSPKDSKSGRIHSQWFSARGCASCTFPYPCAGIVLNLQESLGGM